MRLLLLVPCLVVATLAAATCAAATRARTTLVSRPATADAQATDIQRRVLLASLSAYSSWTRQEAQEKLMTMGESVEAGLVHAAATAVDADARQRARTILDEIRARRRRREITEATRVTLHFDNAPARQVLGSLYVRAGAEPRLFPPDPWESAGEEPVTVHLDNVPFWEAVSKIEELTGMMLVDAGWGASFVKTPPGTVRGRVSVYGPFRVVAEDGPMPGSVGSLKVFLEPKIRVVSHALQAKLAADDGEVRAAKPLGRGWLPSWASTARVIGKNADVLDVELPLVGVIRPVAHVKGTIPAMLVAREELLEDLYPFSGTADIAGRRVTWSLYSPRAEVHVVRILGPDWDAFWAPVPAPARAPPQKQQALAAEPPRVSPTLYDARALPLVRSPNLNVLSAGSYEWTFLQRLTPAAPAKPAAAAAAAAVAARGVEAAPPACGPPARMKFAVPAVTREIEIPFEFSTPAAQQQQRQQPPAPPTPRQ